mmetsp:Transcript_89801/g.159696  ORF Transcript_89801/g.159696 Transcript_89801/m.159696 type:complete len:952 (+) Transcript_89801:42-2897(+)
MAPKRATRSTSLPSLKTSAPYKATLKLCIVDVSKRRISRDLIKGSGGVKRIGDDRLPFAAFERGVEWERPGVMAVMPPVELPPLKKVLKAVRDMRIDMDIKEESSMSFRSGPVAFGGTPFYKGGPKLPRRRDKKQLAEVVSKIGTLPTSTGYPPAQSAPKKILQIVEPDSPKSQAPASDSSSNSSSDGESSDSSDSLAEYEGSAAHLEEQRKMAIDSKEKKAADKAKRARMSVAELCFLKPQEEEEEEEVVGEDGDIPFNWSEDELRAVFIKFDTDSDGELQTDELEMILGYMGCSVPEGDTWIKEQCRFATINWEEFVDFIHKFREVDLQRLRKEFDDADTDDSGELDFDELHALLISMGYSATARTTSEALEALGCQNGVVSFRKFEKLREHLRMTEGLSKHEVLDLRELYDRASEASADKRKAKFDSIPVDLAKKEIRAAMGMEGEMPAEDAYRVFQYLAYSVDERTVGKMVEQVDDGNGFISFQELLKLKRLVRDREFQIISTACDKGGSKMLHMDKLDASLNDIGYFVSEDAKLHILNLMGELQTENHLSIDEMVEFLRHYRAIEGFTPDEVKSMKEVFDEQCRQMADKASLEMGDKPSPKAEKEKEAEEPGLDTLRCGRVMRWFGFPRSIQQVQAMVDIIDLDGSGILEFIEFIKLMHRLFRDETSRRRTIFNSLDKGRTGQVLAPKLHTAIVMLNGGGGSRELAEEAAKLAGFSLSAQAAAVSKRDFELFFKHYRTLAVKEIRQNACYSPAEVQHLRNSFNMYDADKSNTVERKELQKLISEYFPEATKSKEAQREVQLAIKRVDVNNDGQLDFLEFLALMRRCDDSRDEADIKLERKVVKECGYDMEEVEGFRTIFTGQANWLGELNLEDLTEILSKVVDLTAEEQMELGSLVREVHPEHRPVARFPQFLKIMKWITDENYGRVNQASARVLRKARKPGGGSK